MKRRASLLILLLLAAPVRAQTSTDVCRSGEKLLRDVNGALSKGGLAAVEPLVPSMQQAVTDGGACFPSITNPDGSIIMLTDGSAESLLAVGSMAAKKISGSAQFNPFPQLAFTLGSYYNETGKPQDALRTLDKGLSLSPFPDERLGTTDFLLIAEKGAAFNALKRFDDAARNYDEGLKLSHLDDGQRARMYRGRGFSLTELGRLDDAENAYRESLKLVPGHTGALHELAYIAQLRHGAARTEGYLTTAKPPMADQDVPVELRAKKPAAPN